MLSPHARHLAVWGDPIEHSRSPQLHAAAYRALGLEWTYERRRVADGAFDGALTGLDTLWRGLSLTYPLKARAFAAARVRDRRAELTNAVNTLLLTDNGPHGFNTDVGGIIGALGDLGVEAIDSARIVGAGATATSAIVALSAVGVRRIEVVARRPAAVERLVELGSEVGVAVTAAPFAASSQTAVDVTIATLPGDAVVPQSSADTLAASGGPLLDVVYGHWPTSLSTAWDRAGAPTGSGLGMLLHQAVLQVRVFVTGDPETVLDDEPKVVAAMRRAVVGD